MILFTQTLPQIFEYHDSTFDVYIFSLSKVKIRENNELIGFDVPFIFKVFQIERQKTKNELKLDFFYLLRILLIRKKGFLMSISNF